VFGVGIGVGRDLHSLGGDGDWKVLPVVDAFKGVVEEASGGFGVHQVGQVAPMRTLLEQTHRIVVLALSVVGIVKGSGHVRIREDFQRTLLHRGGDGDHGGPFG
jgi:hypothetical protein